MHGGASTGPTNPNPTAGAQASTTHGIYSRFLTEDDRELYNAAEIGNVDAELRVMKLRLARTIKARTAWEAECAGAVDGKSSEGEDSMTLVEVVDGEAPGPDGSTIDINKRTKRLPDFDKIEQACIARIESLEKTRKELLKVDPENPDDPNTGRDHVSFTGGLEGGNDDELPSPFAGKKPK